MKKKKEEREMKEANELNVESMAGKQTPETPEEGYVSSATEKDLTFPVNLISIKACDSSKVIFILFQEKKIISPEKKPKKIEAPVIVTTPEPKSSPTKGAPKTEEIKEEKKVDQKKKAQLVVPPKAVPSDLSNLDVDTHKEKMTDAEHQKMLDKEIAEATEKGNMEKKDNFKLLHYEDPRIIQLKMADVSNFPDKFVSQSKPLIFVLFFKER